MDARRMVEVELLDGFGQDPLAFFLGERLVGFILQVPYFPTLMVVAHPAFKTAEATGRGIEHFGSDQLGLNGGWLDLEGHGTVGKDQQLAIPAGSTAGDGRNEDDLIALFERCGPITEISISCAA